jgi:hypothetical protein
MRPVGVNSHLITPLPRIVQIPKQRILKTKWNWHAKRENNKESQQSTRVGDSNSAVDVTSI